MTTLVAGLAVTPSITLVRELGRGGMGAVWIGEHVVLKRNVAVKLLDPERRASAASVLRFEREAASAARVNSAHVVSVHDAGVSEVVGPFIVMELLVGRDLATVLEAEGPLEPSRVAAIVDHVARGLATAHGQGLVHRDVKAENVFLCEEAGVPELAKLLDFGIALGADERLTEVGVTIGTRLSMSPEQAAGKPVDARSDAYSLALLVFRMLTGHVAIARESLDALGLAAYRAERTRPSSLRLELPAAVDAWFLRATEHEPAARFPSVLELASAFRAALEGVSPVEEPRIDDPSVVRDRTVDETNDGARARLDDARDALSVTGGPARVDTIGATNDGATRPLPEASRENAAPATPRRALTRIALAVASVVALGGLVALGARAVYSEPVATSVPDAGAAIASEAGKQPDLHLSLVMDVSGTNRKRGLAMERAARLAAAMVSESGGVRGRALVVDTIDDQGAEGEFLRARVSDAAARSEARVMFGPLLTVQTATAQAVARERGIVEVSASATGAALATSDTFLGLAPTDDLQAAALAALVRGARPSATVNVRACKGVGIVATNDAHGLPFAKALEGELARGARIPSALVLLDPAPRRSYEAEVKKALFRGANCLVLLVSPKLGARVLLSAPAALRAPLRVLAGDTLASNDFIELGRGDVDDTTSPTVAEGVEGVAVGTSPAASPEFRTFQRKHQERFHEGPDEPFAARQFDAVVLTALALERVGIDAPAARLRDAMIAATRGKHGYGPAELGRLLQAVSRGEDVDYEGAAGDLTFGADGRIAAAFDTWTVRKGKLVRASH